MSNDLNFVSKRYVDDLINNNSNVGLDFQLDYKLDQQTTAVGNGSTIYFYWKYNNNLTNIKIISIDDDDIETTVIDISDINALQENAFQYIISIQNNPVNYSFKLGAVDINGDETFTNPFTISFIITSNTSTGFDSSQPLNIKNTTDATNTSTGSIIANGGISLKKTLRGENWLLMLTAQHHYH